MENEPKSNSKWDSGCLSSDLISEAVEPSLRQFFAFEVVTACFENVGSDLGEPQAVCILWAGRKLAHKELGKVQSLSDLRTLLPYFHLVIVGVALALVTLGDVSTQGAWVCVHLRADGASKTSGLRLSGLWGWAWVLLRLGRLCLSDSLWLLNWSCWRFLIDLLILHCYLLFD